MKLRHYDWYKNVYIIIIDDNDISTPCNSVLFSAFRCLLRQHGYLYSVIKLLVTVYIGVRCNCCLFLDEMSGYLHDLQKLIESSYTENGHQPVILLGHSMGNLYIHHLLTYQSSRWKEKYIKSFISLAGPWGGAVKTLRLEISGWRGSFCVNVGG